MWRNSRRMLAVLMAIWAAVVFNAPAQAQVVLDMPAPKSPPRPQAVVPIDQPDVGEVALTRYARVRSLPYDTYYSGPRYAGVRSFGHPFFGFCGFPHFGCFGNRFVGFVGCPSFKH